MNNNNSSSPSPPKPQNSSPPQSNSIKSSSSNPNSNLIVSSKPIDPGKIVRECIHKIGQIIVQTRIPNHNNINNTNIIDNPSSGTGSVSKSQNVNKWFNLVMIDLSMVRNQIEQQLKLNGPDNPITIDCI